MSGYDGFADVAVRSCGHVMMSGYGFESFGENVEIEGVGHRQGVEYVEGTEDVECCETGEKNHSIV